MLRKAMNRLDVRANMWNKNLPLPLRIPKLSEEAAIEAGSKLIGEIVVFTISSALLVLETVRYIYKTDDFI